MTIRDTMTLGGQFTVRRASFGALRITGDSIWGPPPKDRAAAANIARDDADLAPLDDAAQRDRTRRQPPQR